MRRWSASVVGEVLEIEPETIRVVRPDTLASLPSNSPVGSRMAIMLGGAAFRAAQKLKAQLLRIAAHDLGVAEADLRYAAGDIHAAMAGCALGRAGQLAHRDFYRLPPGQEPGLRARTSCRCRPAAVADAMARCRCIPVIPSSSTWCWWRWTRCSAAANCAAT